MAASKTLEVPQYYAQRDSSTKHGNRMCFSSTCAMAVKYLKPDALKGVNADDDYLKAVLKFGDTVNSNAQVKALASYGIRGSFTQKATVEDIKREINASFPVGAGFNHHGPLNATRGGHWILIIGYNDTHIICHDPYGELDVVNGGYPRPGIGGKSVRYTWKNWLKRWQPEGPGHGWMMSFRRITATPPKQVWPGEDASVARLKRIAELQLLIRKYTAELLQLNIPPPNNSKTSDV
jgi:hypothetical protein